MIFEVSHRTTYHYSTPVLQSEHRLYMTPRSGRRQTVQRHCLTVEPAPAGNVTQTDYFGNMSARLSIDEAHRELFVHARSTVDVHPPDLPRVAPATVWEQVATKARGENGELDISVLEFVSASRHTKIGSEAIDYARPSFSPQRPILEAALDLTQRIYHDFTFDSAATDISTPVSRVLRERRGVCQDFAHLAITCLRSLGLPARYVSGYLLTWPPPGSEKLKGADASHAWISVWAPEIGWVDFDPTNGIMPANEHITVAHGRDYDDVSPISGVLLGGGGQQMSVAVDVTAVG